MIDTLKPELREPFPDIPEIWVCPRTGIEIPKREIQNLEWRSKLLHEAEGDTGLQQELLAASKQSLILWINLFVFTYHQFDVGLGGERIESKDSNRPFVTWAIQDELLNVLEEHLAKGEDILIDKARDLGASWICTAFLHWLWLFRPDSQLLVMSRTRDYCDQPGNMKALLQKHDYLNGYLPAWMLPPDCLFGQKNRTQLHLKNTLNNSCIDGESTTEHAASGDRRLVILLDEFSKVERGSLMRSSTRDAALMRIVNSTIGDGPGTEYSIWKNSGQIKVFVLPFWEHPDKGRGRYVRQKEDGSWEIRSPWYDHEETVRSPKEMAREVNRCDVEAGSQFFTIGNIDKHVALFARDPKELYHIHFKEGTPNDAVPDIIRTKNIKSVVTKRGIKGPLRLWTTLINGRPDQSKEYIFGIDLGKGQGASESVISVKCKDTGEKVGEWRDANTPPYDMARIVTALAIWFGGRNPRKLPFLKWENNGPGWDFGKIIVKEFKYPYYYRHVKTGTTANKKTQSYGFHTDTKSKFELLSFYDRILAHGGYINHSRYGLEQMKLYIHYNGGGIGPAFLVEESDSARKCHGDVVIADALTLDDSEIPKAVHSGPEAPINSLGYRRQEIMNKKKVAKRGSWRKAFV